MKKFSLISSNKKYHVESDKSIIDYIENTKTNSLTTVYNHLKKRTFFINVIINDGEILFFSEGSGAKIDLSNDRKEQIF